MKSSLHTFGVIGLNRSVFGSLVGLLAWFCLTIPAIAEKPILRVSSEQHLGPINSISVSPDGAAIVTVSDDKTVRLWNAEDGELVQVMRTPIGDGPDGVLYDAQFDWSGTRLLAGGISFDEDRKNGLFALRPGTREFRARIPLQGTMSQIRLSTNQAGERLVAISLLGSGGRGALQLRNGRFQETAFHVFEASPNWIEFLPDSRILVALSSGEIAIYKDGKRDQSFTPNEGGNPAVARVSPDGTLLAVGYWNRRQVDIFRLKDFRHVEGLVGRVTGTTKSTTLHFNAVAWRPVDSSAGGGEVWAGGTHADINSGRTIVRRWPEVTNPNLYHDLPIADDSLKQLEALPDGNIVFAASDPRWGVIKPGMKLKYVRDKAGPDFRSVWRNLFAINDDGQKLAFQFDLSGAHGRFVFDFDRMELLPEDDFKLTSTAKRIASDQVAEAPKLSAGWRGPKIPEGLHNFVNSSAPTFKGKTLELLPGELSRSVDVLPDDAEDHGLPPGGFVIGADRGLYIYDAAGERVQQVYTATAVFGVMTLDHGRILAAMGDGSFKIFRADGGLLIEVAGLFFARPGKLKSQVRWLAWLKDGQFTHSPNGGQQLAGYHLDRGPAALARWVDFSQIYAGAYAPDAVRDFFLGTPSELQESNTGAPSSEQFPGATIQSTLTLTPEVFVTEICPSQNGQTQPCVPVQLATRGIGKAEAGSDAAADYVGGVREVSSDIDAVRLNYRVTGIDGLPDRIDVFLNGRSTGVDLVTRGIGTATFQQPGQNTVTGSRDVFLVDGLNRIRIRAYARSGSFGISQEVTLYKARSVLAAKRPTLHVLAIGADEYSDQIGRLRFAASDAQRVLSTMSEYKTSEYSEIREYPLIGASNVSRAAILSAFDTLSNNIAPNDGLVVYIAGHGIQTDRGRYVFIPPEVSDTRRIETDGLDQDLLLRSIGRIRAENKLILLDTCHAGAFEAPSRAAGVIGNEGGFMVVAAAAPRQEALDGYNDEGGVFSHALIKGLKGAAALGGQQVEAATLGIYISRVVPDLAREKNFAQIPIIQNSNVNQRFPLTEGK